LRAVNAGELTALIRPSCWIWEGGKEREGREGRNKEEGRERKVGSPSKNPGG